MDRDGSPDGHVQVVEATGSFLVLGWTLDTRGWYSYVHVVGLVDDICVDLGDEAFWFAAINGWVDAQD